MVDGLFVELIWRCIVWRQLKRLFAILLGCMSAAILLAEATLLPSGVDLSVFSLLINSLATQEMLVQVLLFPFYISVKIFPNFLLLSFVTRNVLVLNHMFINFLWIVGCCVCSSFLHVHLHILLFVQNWYADLLFIYAKAHKLCEFAHDMLVRLAVFVFKLIFLFQ